MSFFSDVEIIFSSLEKPDSRDIMREEDVIQHYWKSVNQVTIHYTTGINFDRVMEDEHISIDEFGNKNGQAFFGIFDGHGGRKIASRLVSQIPFIYNSESKDIRKTEQDIWRRTFEIVDSEFYFNNLTEDMVGSTAACAVIKKIGDRRFLSCANVGDSRIVMIYNEKAVRLTSDHRPIFSYERERIFKEGGMVKDGRVQGILAVSRAFGDIILKNKGVSVLPFVTTLEIVPDISHIILACDGVWDVMNDDEVVDIIINSSSLDEAGIKIIERSLKSMDNITLMIVKL